MNVVIKANQVLGLILKVIVNWDNKFITVTLYKELVWPHLDCCPQAWRPYLQFNIDLLKGVQRWQPKMVKAYWEQVTSQNCFHWVNHIGMQKTYCGGDLIEVFKLLKGDEAIEVTTFFQANTNITRGHFCQLFKHRFWLDLRKYTFSQRVII